MLRRGPAYGCAYKSSNALYTRINALRAFAGAGSLFDVSWPSRFVLSAGPLPPLPISPPLSTTDLRWESSDLSLSSPPTQFLPSIVSANILPSPVEPAAFRAPVLRHGQMETACLGPAGRRVSLFFVFRVTLCQTSVVQAIIRLVGPVENPIRKGTLICEAYGTQLRLIRATAHHRIR
jgi:hypothetical protein